MISCSQVERVCIVEHYPASRSHLPEWFRDTFPGFSVANKSTKSRLVNPLRDTGTLRRVSSEMTKRINANMHASLNAVRIFNT